MARMWPATGAVVLLVVTISLCLSTPVLATLPASRVVRHSAGPDHTVDNVADHGHAAKLKIIHESATNSHVVSDPTLQHKLIPDQGANHKVVLELDLHHNLDPESLSRHKFVPEFATNNKVALEPEEKHTVISEPGDNHEVINKPGTKNKAVPEPAGKLDGIPGAVRPLAVKPEVRPGQVGDVAATTTTVDPFTAFCQEACKAGVGGPECNCPGHPVGRRQAPPFTP